MPNWTAQVPGMKAVTMSCEPDDRDRTRGNWYTSVDAVVGSGSNLAEGELAK